MRERKNKKARLAHKVFLVICEGETEKAYIEALTRFYRLPLTIKTKVSGNSINARLVKEYVKETGVEKADDCKVFYIYDLDVKAVADKLIRLPGLTVLSNPCIELWFLLHAHVFNKYSDSQNILKTLVKSEPVWKGYEKGRLSTAQAKWLISKRLLATENASKLNFPDNPSSNMGQFIDILEHAKND